MRILLHIGLPKTGTTTLQQFLHTNQEQLNSRGIFYPVHQAMGRLRGINHRILLSHIAIEALARGSIPGHAFPENALKKRPIVLQKAFDRFWTSTLRQIRERKPNVLVFSCEGLCQHFEATESPNALVRLRALLEQALVAAGHPKTEVGCRTQVIAYLRSPKDHLRSLAQQKFRFHQEVSVATLLPPIESIFDAYEHVFETPMSVHSADRSALINGCSTSDFLHKYLPVALDLLPAARSNVAVNQSLDTASLWALNRRLASPPRWVPASLLPDLRARLLITCARLNKAHNLTERYPLTLTQSINWVATQQTNRYNALGARFGLTFEPWESDEQQPPGAGMHQAKINFRLNDVYEISKDAGKASDQISVILRRNSYFYALELCARKILRWIKRRKRV